MVIREPGRVLVMVSAGVLLAAAAMVLLGALRLGATTDEPFHVQRWENFSTTGWYLADFQLDRERPGPGVTDQFVYGPATTALLQGLGPSGVDEADYRLRHVGIALISLLGVAAVVATARIMLRSWRWGLVAGAVLGAMPLWTGLGMFNLKDTPVATGCALVTLGLTVLAREDPGSRRVRVAAPASTAVGLFLSVGTRPGIWVLVFAAVVVGIALIGLGPGWTRWRSRELLAGVGIAAAALAWLYPKVFLDPDWFLRSVTSSSQFGAVRAKKSFVPIHVLTDQPLLITVLALGGSVFVLHGALAARRRLAAPEIGGLLVLVQAAALPMTTLLHHTALENDLRQLLHAAPAVAVLATVAVARVAARTRPVVATSVAAVALIAPTVDQATLFPYNYVWTNPIDDLRRLSTQDQRDYMALSFAEAAESLEGPGRLICNKQTDREGLYRTPPMRLDDEDCPILSPAFGRRDRDVDLVSSTFWFVGMRFEQPDTCTETKRVTRLLHGRTVPLSVLARCTRDFLQLGTTVTPVDGDDRTGTTAFASGWTIPVEGRPNPWGRPGARATGSSAALAFTVPDDLRGRALDLVLDTDGRAQEQVTARVGSAITPVRWEGSALRIPFRPGAGPRPHPSGRRSRPRRGRAPSGREIVT